MLTQPNINKVESTGIITIDPFDFQPTEESVPLDLKNFLYQGLIIQENHFKDQLAQVDWLTYHDKNVSIFCSVDTIIPPWTYMMLTSKLSNHAKSIYFGTNSDHNLLLWREVIISERFNQYKDKKVVIKAHVGLDPSIFIALSEQLMPFVKTLMYGEPGLPKVIWKSDHK
tara:strand:+ start:545 stop:1054 length:510 start_codon:yes stop_codon:yes gene_type:complete